MLALWLWTSTLFNQLTSGYNSCKRRQCPGMSLQWAMCQDQTFQQHNVVCTLESYLLMPFSKNKACQSLLMTWAELHFAISISRTFITSVHPTACTQQQASKHKHTNVRLCVHVEQQCWSTWWRTCKQRVCSWPSRALASRRGRGTARTPIWNLLPQHTSM